MTRSESTFRGLRYQLVLLVLAAAAGSTSARVAHTRFDVAGIVAAIAFGGALALRAFAGRFGDERNWYEGRAAAESVKTLCWRFSVCGDPFPERMSSDEARNLLIARFSQIDGLLRHVQVTGSASSGGEITTAMIKVRSSPRVDRVACYARDRIEAQQNWYAMKARWNVGRARVWLAGMLAAESLGLVGAIVKAVGLVSIDLLGILSAAAAAIVSWINAKQYEGLAAAYNVAAGELRRVATLTSVDINGSDKMNGDEWASFVGQAENAISREHTMWIASKISLGAGFEPGS